MPSCFRTAPMRVGVVEGVTGIREVRGMDEPVWLAERIAAAEDPNSVITEVALAARAEAQGVPVDSLLRKAVLHAGNCRHSRGS